MDAPKRAEGGLGAPRKFVLQYEREAAQKALANAERDFCATFRDRNINMSWRSTCGFVSAGGPDAVW